MKGTSGQQLSVCDVCTTSKMHELLVPKWTDNKATAKSGRVFTDIQGPFEKPSLQGARYAISFIDDFSRYAVVKFMVHKSDAPEMFKLFIAECGARWNAHILECDRSCEVTTVESTLQGL